MSEPDQEAEAEREPDVPAENPAVLSSLRNYNDDRWFESNGELLWDAAGIESVHDRLVEMSETEWEKVALSPMATVMGRETDFLVRGKIRTKDVDDFEADFRERVNAVSEDVGGWLLQKPAPDIHEKGPRRTDVRINYGTGQAVAMGGADYKRQKIINKVRDYEYWLFHTRIFEPVLEEYVEKYPY